VRRISSRCSAPNKELDIKQPPLKKEEENGGRIRE